MKKEKEELCDVYEPPTGVGLHLIWGSEDKTRTTCGLPVLPEGTRFTKPKPYSEVTCKKCRKTYEK